MLNVKDGLAVSIQHSAFSIFRIQVSPLRRANKYPLSLVYAHHGNPWAGPSLCVPHAPKEPRALTTVAVLSLALGIGANTTIFTFINGLLLRPPMVHDPDRLLEVWQHNTTRGNGIGSDMQLSFPDTSITATTTTPSVTSEHSRARPRR